MDLEQIEFHQRVREGYHQLAALDPQRWVIIDADRGPKIVQANLQNVFLERHKKLAIP
jgi:dTMP kinase